MDLRQVAKAVQMQTRNVKKLLLAGEEPVTLHERQRAGSGFACTKEYIAAMLPESCAGMSVRQLADEYGLTVETAYSRIQRGIHLGLPVRRQMNRQTARCTLPPQAWPRGEGVAELVREIEGRT